MTKIKLESRINSGSFGEVFRATVQGDGRKVAVKRLSKPYSDEDVKRFSREVRIMIKLNHPNIIKILFTALDYDPPMFVMPLAECNLNDILADLRINEERRRFIFLQILQGMNYAHENGVLHRDIKPQNILVMKGDHIAIADFGIGCFVNRDTTTLTKRGDQLGTIMYSAPEQLTDLSLADIRSDIYSLGKILYQMITNRPVFPITNLDGLDGKYVYIIQKCLAIDPDKRYQTVSELMTDFNLLTQVRFNIESPTELAKKIIGEIIDPVFGIVNSKGVDSLVKLFVDNTDNKDLYVEILPYIPIEVLQKLMTENLDSFIIIVQAFDKYVCGNLVFAYCDVVAKFYLLIYHNVQDFYVKRIVLNRLLIMGHNHNRFFVRDVLAELLLGIQDLGEAKLALDVLRNDIYATIWAQPSINIDKLHPLIREGIHEILKPSDDEYEIPF